MIVTRGDLERHIRELGAEIADPRSGIYGPESTSWTVDKEAILFLAGGRAVLLQLAHPFVAEAVDQHSATRHDPFGRFRRTFDNVFAMVFGDLDTAARCARRVHAIHTRIVGEISEDVGAFPKGTRYEANDEDALLWVHATLLDSAVRIFERVVRPLEQREKERYYQESKRFARLFGISDRVLPPTWPAFVSYVDRMLASDVLRVGRPAKEIAGFLFQSPHPAFDPLFRWLEVMTAGLMPERLRREFDLPFGRSARAVFSGSLRALEVGYPLLPRRVRYVPAYIQARRRLAGIDTPDRVGALLERVITFPLALRSRGS